ncbi:MULTISPECIES: thiamine diphosphokinase [Thioclava]|uniref:Thiamine diphosphokinase n=1 Tax=Thioclava electrotropha TaxID=1549850 RepID=A0ABX6YS22_9RHOB|nr:MULTISPECIES: thiamine diphosphokinase [Thioclava]MPQ92316.1 thiamine diphosphokinase [Thioclava sp. JE_KL1]QPZ90503.1 thiamine diphosphokinase [Thioclava electrotropha]
MISSIVHSSTGVSLLGAGAVNHADVDEALTIAPCLVAADGGGDRALAMGLEPEAVIGDLDSLSDAARATLGPRVHPVAEQDSTDFAKCLQRIKAPFILALGFTGMRLDHTLAAMTDLIRTPHRVVMLAEEEVIFRCPPSLSLDVTEGTRVSLFPFGEVKARSEGLQWPLDGIGFTPAERVGTSNRATGPVRIMLEGPALMMLPREELAAALTGLGIG